MNHPEHHHQLRNLVDNAPGEIDGIPLSLKPSLYDARDYRNHLLFTAPSLTVLPRETFNRERLPGRNPKFNQDPWGTCTTASACTGFLAKNAQDQGIYPAEGLSPRFNYAIEKNLDGNPHQAGSDLRTDMKVCQKYGAIPDSLYPTAQMTQDYDLPMPPQSLIDQAAKWKIAGYSLLLAATDTDRSTLISHVMAALAAGNILEIGILVCQNFMDMAGPDWLIPIPQGTILGCHALKLIDYRTRNGQHDYLTWNTWGGRWADNDEAWFSEDWLTGYLDLDGLGSKYYYMSEVWQALNVLPPKLPAKTIALTVGNPIAIVNGVDVQIDTDPGVVPTIIRDRLFLPARFVGENLGAQVDWEAGEKEAVITA
jgi:hypothetical protein